MVAPKEGVLIALMMYGKGVIVFKGLLREG